MPNRDLLKRLHEETIFREIMKQVISETPDIPSYQSGGSYRSDEWVYRSGMRDGYLLVLTKLGIRGDDHA